MHVIALFHLLNCALQTLVFTTLYAFHMHMLFRWDYFTPAMGSFSVLPLKI